VGLRGAALGSAAAIAILAGCGGDDTFSADELVGELNDNGAGLELDDQLPSSRQGIELYGLRFADQGSGEAEAVGGSLTITPDADAGLEEYGRCQSAGSLICFRADNAVLIFEGELPAGDRARLAAALEALTGG
jgi:hypothetical protein